MFKGLSNSNSKSIMASSSLILSPSFPMEQLGSNCDSSRDATGDVLNCTERRRGCPVPWLMLPPESSVCKFHRLAEGDVIQVETQLELDVPKSASCLWGSPFQGWLFYLQPSDCQIVLFNPLSGKSFNLPSIETLPSIIGVIRNSHSGLVESFLDPWSPPRTPQELSRGIIKRMVLSSSPLDDDCIAVVIHGSLEKLAFCRRPWPGSDPNCWAWTALDSPIEQFNQIVFDSGKKLFFAFTGQKELEAWDLHSDPIKSFSIRCEDFGLDYWPVNYQDDVELKEKEDYCYDSDYLVYDHQSQELFIVTRYIASGIEQDGTLVLFEDNPDDRLPYKTRTFDVFKLDFIDYNHVKLQFLQDSLGDRAFFIGSNPGFALSTTEFPELRPNSIYFTDDVARIYLPRNLTYGGHDLGIYDYEEGIFLSCYYPIDADKIQKILPAPIWFTPDVHAEFSA